MDPTQYAAIKSISDPGKARVMMFANGQPAHAPMNAVTAASVHNATAKATPVDADEFGYYDSVSAGPVKATWANIKATLKTYFDTLYQPLAATLTSWAAITRASGFDTFVATPTSANLRALLTDEDGTGPALFGGSSFIRERLTGNRTYYVRTDGSDSNTGLVNSAGGAFLTVQKALNTVTDTLDLAGFAVTIQMGNGTYTGAWIMSRPVVGGSLTVTGDTTTPSNVVISTTSIDAITVSGRGVILNIQGIKVTTTTAGHCVFAIHGGVINIVGKVDFGAVPTNYAHIIAQYGGVVTANVAYNITGAASYHMRAEIAGSMIQAIASVTVTITGSPAFGTAFAYADTNATIYGLLVTYSGTVTGKRYSSTLNSVINTNGSGINYFPGSVAGTTATGGQYA